MVLFTKLLTAKCEFVCEHVILSMVLFTKLLTQVYTEKWIGKILSMVLFTKLLTSDGHLDGGVRF